MNKKTSSRNLVESLLGTAQNNLEYGKLYSGFITAVDSGLGTCVVLTEGPGKEIDNVLYATGGMMSPLLGFKTRTVPPLGSRVMVLYGKPSFVVGQANVEGTDPVMGHKKSSSGQCFRSGKDIYGDGIVAGPVVDSDVLEGEFDISNAMNVGLLFLNNVITMKAGDRAKVETCLLNDMVRIISEVYRHHSAFGDCEIYNDGQLNVEWHGTSLEHESYNESDPKSPKVPTKNGEVDFDSLEDSSLFKQRFSAYLGFLGDFVQLFIREPQETQNSIITGKAKLHINSSGGIFLSSVDEIVFERATRVIVPRRKVDHDSPEGDLFHDELPTEPLVEWDYGPGNKNIHHVAYQLREYARYLSSHKSLARFRQKKKDFEVPAESDIPAPSYTNQEQDREGVNGNVTFFETYSTIRMLRGGGIILVAGDGSSLNLGNRQATLSSLERIVLDTPGDIEMNAGGGIYGTAYKDIHLTAVTGNIIQKARNKFHLLTEKGLLWLKSDGNEEKAEGGKFGIYLDAAESDLAVNAKKELCLRSEEEDVVLRSDKKSIILRAKENITQLCKSSLIQAIGKGLVFNVKRAQFLCKNFKIGENVEVTDTRVSINGRLNVVGKAKVGGGIWNGEAVWKLSGNKRHNGHVHVLSSTMEPFPDDGSMTELATQLLMEASASNEVLVRLDSSSWRYDAQDFPDREADGTYVSTYRTWTQDYAFTHAEEFGDSYVDWKWSTENRLLPSSRTVPSMPYPGDNGLEEMVHPNEAGDVLDKPAPEYKLEQTPLEASDIVRKRRK